MEERKEQIKKEMNKVKLAIEMNKFDKEKFAQLKETYNLLKKEYAQILLEEKMPSKKM